jgi:Toprim domain
VPDLSGTIIGAHRTWLAPDGSSKAPVDTPRRAMGGLLGHAVRFGAADDVLAVGEGIETMLSLRAACHADGCRALGQPPCRARAAADIAPAARDADAAGDMALAAVTDRAEAAGIEVLGLSPIQGDFNEDLQAFGLRELRAALRPQLAPQDAARFTPR